MPGVLAQLVCLIASLKDRRVNNDLQFFKFDWHIRLGPYVVSSEFLSSFRKNSSRTSVYLHYLEDKNLKIDVNRDLAQFACLEKRKGPEPFFSDWSFSEKRSKETTLFVLLRKEGT